METMGLLLLSFAIGLATAMALVLPLALLYIYLVKKAMAAMFRLQKENESLRGAVNHYSTRTQMLEDKADEDDYRGG